LWQLLRWLIGETGDQQTEGAFPPAHGGRGSAASNLDLALLRGQIDRYRYEELSHAQQWGWQSEVGTN